MRKIIYIILLAILLTFCGTTTEPNTNLDRPTDLEAECNYVQEVTLSWNYDNGIVEGFLIQRKTEDGVYAIIDTTDVGIYEYKDINVNVGTTYYYMIAALSDDYQSEWSDEVSVFVPDRPTNLNADCNYVQEVSLSWVYFNGDEMGFLIQRKAESGDFVIIDTIETEIYDYIDPDVTESTTYYYRVAAIYADSQSEWSDEESVFLKMGFQSLNFGSDPTLEVVTWNLEHFPKNLSVTVDYAAQIIRGLNADIYALQEIESNTYFEYVIETLNNDDPLNTWAGYRASTASYSVNLAYIYKTNIIEITDIYEIYSSYDYSREFPRRPLLMEMQWNGNNVYIINNHLKALGDGYLDLGDAWDEETRRYDACNLLDEYISQNLPDENVIILGDMNDELTDLQSNNVFVSFLNEADEYDFTDMEIAEGSSVYWSYPSWPSHLDHILITNELFDEFVLPNSYAETLCIDDLLDGGLSEYDNNVSDHRPVGLKLDF
ncbi:MAG: endonuclease/exonuclease/phosphatase family protein [Candidatus Cloacimonetes bacterium]|jgi:endonuclease/exonuclease/phosphatase family metal-dependent hydrolase|nr:endonuclease/exonuclease/phosphatase family protein [Candidatus Cloacimonadota bacterium]